jgi:hypothetical protein
VSVEKTVKDSKGRDIFIGSKVICVDSSVLMIPVCTHPVERPVKVRKGRSWSSDEQRKKEYDFCMKNAFLHTDIILNKKDVKKLDNRRRFGRSLFVKDISGNHISFHNTKDMRPDEVLHHYHPADRFLVIGINSEKENS